MARWVKLFDLAAMVFGGLSLWLENPVMHLIVLFFAGTTAAFFGPLKYGVLPQYLRREELIAGNALIELGTFVTILLGTLFGGFLVLDGFGRDFLAISIIVLAVIALICAFFMPAAPGDRSITSTGTCRAPPGSSCPMPASARTCSGRSSVHPGSGSWGRPAQLPVFTRDVLLADDAVANAFIGLFTIGIGAGSLLTNALKGESRRATCPSRRS